MNCKNKKYEDGERTLCTVCYKKMRCEQAIRCAVCGSTSMIYYEKKHDLFLCPRCEHKIGERI